ncbi:helix-turn-helix transcriptional regulator [Bacillus sp. CECT 9360]|uniref:helix-turn-helix transcriptional regulator n=1 Tax=Bacillus sp. CECT 9360 TaxID=2845821 RepID=UPI001E4D1EC0|nr:helix-turn-helix transcriptional regulator [Bacillus sp. CECT 9360]CAH0345802.1 Transcriptional activator NprA [Bacillus sp. CECT 9360]
MKIGSLIKYYRTKAHLTQSELAQGICSVPHLSKIENNGKEANEETISLILRKLGINIVDIEMKKNEIKILLDEFIEHINFYQKDKAKLTFEKLNKSSELITFTSFIYLFELYKFRYYLLLNLLELAEEQRKWLSKQKMNFSQHETYIFNSYFAIYLILKRRYPEADELLIQLVHNQNHDMYVSSEVYYHLAMVKGNIEQPGHAVLYGKKALQLYSSQYNFKRMLHTLMVLGINYTHSEIYPEALDCFKHLERNTELLGDSSLIPQVYHNIGFLKRKMDLMEEAVEFFRKSLDLQDHKNPHYLVTLYSLAETYYSLGRIEQSVEAFNETLAISKETINPRYRLLASFYLLLLNNEEPEAYRYLEEKVLPFLKSTGGHRHDLQAFSRILAKYLQDSGQFEAAIDYFS